MKKKVWITNYRPFIMGGDVNAPIMCEVEILGEYDLGKDYTGWLFVIPSGKTFVAESITGAIIGNTLEMVREDIAEGNPQVMEQQINDAKEIVKKAYMGTEEEFWKRLG